MNAGYNIAVAISDDLSGILALQDANQPDRGGMLSVRFPHEWIQAAIANEAIMVARRDDKIAGYVISGELSAQAHVPVAQAMLRAYAPPLNTTCMDQFVLLNRSAAKVLLELCSMHCGRVFRAGTALPSSAATIWFRGGHMPRWE
jgi:hypothetical protein